MDELYRQFNYVDNYVCKNLYVITLFGFFLFILFWLWFPHHIPTTYYYRYLPIDLAMEQLSQ
jgi:hypothetical protein